MGWLIVIIVLPIVFMILGVYVVVKLSLLLLRVAFAPLALLRR
jgi:hypothetical protein